jgi:hypothetical protein
MPDINIDLDPASNFIPPTSEPESPLVAGFLSENNLVKYLGVTSERQSGYMTVQGIDNWYSKLVGTYPVSAGVVVDGTTLTGNWPNGPTGVWKNEWWHAHNYLLYGGTLIVGSTGESTNVVGASATLKNEELRFDVIFGSTAAQNTTLIDISSTRKDCISICGIGVTQAIGISGDVDIPAGTSGDKYTFFVAGSKYHLNSTSFSSTEDDVTTLQLTPLTADTAGCFARTRRTAQSWSSPAGFARGRILGVVRLQQSVNSSASDILYAENVNPVRTFSGEGTFLFGDKSRRQPSESASYAHINVTSLVVYLRQIVGDISRNVLFEINDSSTRNSFINMTQPVLRTLLGSGGITEYNLICDTTNNTTTIIENNKFVADIYIKPSKSIQTIQLHFVTALSSDNIT